MIGVGSIISAISGAMSLLDHLWTAFNSSSMVQAKVAQMSEDQKAAHNQTIATAMHDPDPKKRAAALEELRKLAAE